MMDSSCIMCAKCTASGDCRILHSSSTIHVLPVLKRFMYDAFGREIVDRRVPSCTQPGCSMIICKCCFTSLDRCSKKREELDKIENDIAATISAGVHLGFTATTSQPPGSTPSRKRSSSQLAAAGTLSPSVSVRRWN